MKGVVANNGLALEFVSGGWLGLIFDGSLGGTPDEVAYILYFDKLVTRYSIRTNRRQRERERERERERLRVAALQMFTPLASCHPSFSHVLEVWLAHILSYTTVLQLFASFCFNYFLTPTPGLSNDKDVCMEAVSDRGEALIHCSAQMRVLDLEQFKFIQVLFDDTCHC